MKTYESSIRLQSLWLNNDTQAIIDRERQELVDVAKRDYPNAKVSRVFETVVKAPRNEWSTLGKWIVKLKVKVYDTTGKRFRTNSVKSEEEVANV